jgi:hypothetical protein
MLQGVNDVSGMICQPCARKHNSARGALIRLWEAPPHELRALSRVIYGTQTPPLQVPRLHADPSGRGVQTVCDAVGSQCSHWFAKFT